MSHFYQAATLTIGKFDYFLKRGERWGYDRDAFNSSLSFCSHFMLTNALMELWFSGIWGQ